jgi:hypothetical protein
MNRYFSFIILQVLIVSSCGDDKLTATKAEKLLKESGRFPRTENVEFEYGIVGYRYDSLPAEYYKIQEQGAIRIQPLGKSGLFTVSYVFNVELTDAGKSFLLEEDKQPTKQGDRGYLYKSKFKTCETDLEKVETVHEIPAVNEAEVSYIAKRKNFTPFWYKHYSNIEHRITEDTIEKRETTLFKTDKGWSAKK